MTQTPQTIGSVIAMVMMIIYFTIKGIKELAEHFGWFSQKHKEKVREAQEKKNNETKSIVEESIKNIVPPMLQIAIDHNVQQDENLKKLVQSSNDMLRFNMVQIYYKYLPYKKILYYDRENFNKLFKNYEGQNGNSFITHIKQEVDTWETVMKEEDL